MARVHCVGSMNMDIAAYSARLPHPGETVMGDAIVSSPAVRGSTRRLQRGGWARRFPSRAISVAM